MKRLIAFLKREKSLVRNAAEVLSINQRNLLYIYTSNKRKHFPLADDKLVTKQVMRPAGVPVPRTYHVYRNFMELSSVGTDLFERQEFVIKPSKGRAGGGIVVIKGREGSGWLGMSGKNYSVENLKRHMADIIFGVYSFDLSDAAIVEERLVQDPKMAEISPLGLADVRVILFKGKPVLGMLRIPTKESDGRANLHKGAVGAGVDISIGRTSFAICNGKDVVAHPDTGKLIVGLYVPHWQEVLRVSRVAAEAVPLEYLGVDMTITTGGPVLLEINVRPGLEIQNANARGMRQLLENILNESR